VLCFSDGTQLILRADDAPTASRWIDTINGLIDSGATGRVGRGSKGLGGGIGGKSTMAMVSPAKGGGAGAMDADGGVGDGSGHLFMHFKAGWLTKSDR
jgi:hypothetical protein